MNNFSTFEDFEKLFDEPYESAIIQDFLSQMPSHKADKPSDGDQYIICKSGGFDLLFRDSGTVGRGKKQDRRLVTIFLYNSGADKHERYTGPLPLGFTFDDMRPELIKKSQPLRTRIWGEDAPVTHPFPLWDGWKVGALEFNANYYTDTHEIHHFQLERPSA